jgi:hypothetical protein
MEPVKVAAVQAGRLSLAQPEWLAAHLDDPAVRVVEVDVSSRAYDEWHIDGAVLWNVYQDLKDADYRLVDTASVERLLARSGISPDSTVVFYGYAPAMGFWLMKLCGHQDVRILDCSRDAWQAEGRAVNSQVPTTRRCGTPSAPPAKRSSTCVPGTSTGASGSGPPAVWSRAAGLATSPRRSTSRSTACMTSAERSGPSRTCARSSPPWISTAEKS